MPLPPSTLLANKYRIEAIIGQGAFGRVYRARDVNLDRLVAIKELHKGDGELSSTAYNDYARRFRREAKVQARFNHPHIVHVYELLEPEQDLLYLVMECVEGGTLKDLIERKGASLPMEDVVRLSQEIMQGLAHVHDDPRDIVHRDIKPSNILLTKDGHAKISDFGLAQVGDESMRSITGESHPGTPTYMSLEQGTSSDYLTHKSDLFSAGCVLFEMLTGVLYKHAKRKRQTLKDLRPDVPQWLETVIEQAVNEDYHARPDTAEAMVEMLSEGWRAEIEKKRQAIEQAKREEALKQREAQERAAREKAEIEARAKAEQAKQEAERRQREEQERLVRENAEAEVRAKAEQAKRDEERLAREQKAKDRKPDGGSSVPIIAIVSLSIFAIVILGVVSLGGVIIANFTQPTQVVARPSTTQPPNTPTPEPSTTPTTTPLPPQVSDKDGMTLLYIPAGEFLMGSDKTKDSLAQDDEQPQHKVHLDAFRIDKTEVTNAMYALCVKAGVCSAPTETKSWTRSYYGNAQYNNYPVIYVSWNDANKYCGWVGRRLPTEAEWEKAARGTDGRLYPWGNASPDSSLLNFNQNEKDTTEVGKYSKGASVYGALDMAGNAWEWVADWYDASYYKNSPSQNPKGASSGQYRVLRGGAWYNDVNYTRASNRDRYVPTVIVYDIGFRCASSP